MTPFPASPKKFAALLVAMASGTVSPLVAAPTDLVRKTVRISQFAEKEALVLKLDRTGVWTVNGKIVAAKEVKQSLIEDKSAVVVVHYNKAASQDQLEEFARISLASQRQFYTKIARGSIDSVDAYTQYFHKAPSDPDPQSSIPDLLP